MSKKGLPHIITVALLVVFIVLGVASASVPEVSGTQTSNSAIEYFNKSVAHYNKEEYELAIEDLNAAIRLDPTNADFYNNRAWINASHLKRNLSGAIQDANHALRLSPNNTQYLISRGWIYFYNDDWDSAIADFETVIRIASNRQGSEEFLAEAKKGQSLAQELKANIQQAKVEEFKKQEKAVYFSGDGGQKISLGIGTPKSQGLSEDMSYIPTLVQGVLVDSISKYSQVKVLDRVSLDRVIEETLDPTFEDNLDIVRLGHVAQVANWLTGNIIRTSTGYTLQLNITDTTPNAVTVASYTGTCTVAEFDNHTAIHKAALTLLDGMGVTLTDKGKAELAQASSQRYVQAQAALSQGIVAQRQGAEVAAIVYLNQAAALEPSLAKEATSRSVIVSADIKSGNISTDARNDIVWRRQWVERLIETEELYYKIFSNRGLPYTLFYSTDIQQGKIDYQRETIELSFPINIRINSDWVSTLDSAVQTVQVVYDGLRSTERASTWGLRGDFRAPWPSQSKNRTFGVDWGTNFLISFELLNDKNQVIGNETVTLRPCFEVRKAMDWSREHEIERLFDENTIRTVCFYTVKVDDTSNVMTIRVASINGNKPENAGMQITPLSDEDWRSTGWK